MGNATETTSKLTYKHYVCYPDDGQRHEIIDGDHYVNPAPNTTHQRISSRIQYQLYDQIEETGRGAIFTAPTDVQLTEYDIIQPDLIVVMEARRLIITPTKLKGTPSLIIEILSPATATNDRSLKKELYERAEVPEYWIVDPEEHAVEQFALQNGKYLLVDTHSKDISAATISDVLVDLTKVW